ncbi:hypothetical protein M404DRAFT_29560 [Pisolithus tinctorius Marx 270]|uniref:Uncharacterized protein n=1 Tax=Pisolithus tinctorius Marx 270 TaxID=870435 RepID=A0A0C3IU86_PISTI|nr:hypothetical protein M404DRAFT_29560 [Pisolithus tinctorius Marx 270]
MSSSSLSHKLFKKSPELNAVANCILQIYFKDIAESSKLGKADKIAKWRGAIKAINDELDAVHDLIARMDEILMTLISINTFLKWHEDLGSIDHPWPEWKTALAPSKTDLGLPMPCVVPTPTPPTQETEMPMSNKGKWKATEVEVEQMIAEGLHRMEVDNEGEDEAPEKEDNEEEPATAETIDEDDVPAQGQSKHKPHPPSDGLYGRAALAFRRTPSPDPHSCKSCHRRKRFVFLHSNAGIPAQSQGVEESTVAAETHPSTTAAPVQPTTAATPSALSPVCAPIANILQTSNTIKQRITDLERQLCDAEAHRQYYGD